MKSLLLLAVPFALIVATAGAQTPAKGKGKDMTKDMTKDKTATKEFRIEWKKVVLDTKFRSEGVAVADVDGDGKKDILVGDVWYEAPKWAPRAIRKEKTYDGKNGYSESFAVFAEDIDKDGLVDQIVVGFPGAPCYWYKNPGKDGGAWKAFMIQDNACNETPLFVDLLGVKKKGLLLGHKGEMAFFMPGSDPTKPWTKIAISGPFKSELADKNLKRFPGTDKFDHGLGVGDVNGDGKLDVLTSGGWWEQPPSNPMLAPWKFHRLSVPACADMYAFDLDNDGKNDIISTSAHGTGIWWHQQKEGKDEPAFVTQLLFPLPASLAKAPEGYKFTKEEGEIYAAINKIRAEQKRAPWRTNRKLCQDARTNAPVAAATDEKKFRVTRGKYEGNIVATDYGELTKAIDIAREFVEGHDKLKLPGLEVGIGIYEGIGKKHYLILIGDRDQFATPGQTHALNFVDVDGDGLKDLVTGRRFWAHGPNGDDTPGDPALLYWLKAKRDKGGFTTFDPQLIDDDSGIGTQFVVEDVDGDGLMDVVVSNKRGVFLFLQIREPVIRRVPPPEE